jgi:pimeloyl-ACP methyl ester carboxylesterase
VIRGPSERFYRVKAPTLLIWGESDNVIPSVYADAFKRMPTGAASVKVQKISAVGHALFAEQPKASAAAIIDFCAS